MDNITRIVYMILNSKINFSFHENLILETFVLRISFEQKIFFFKDKTV